MAASKNAKLDADREETTFKQLPKKYPDYSDISKFSLSKLKVKAMSNVPDDKPPILLGF